MRGTEGKRPPERRYGCAENRLICPSPTKIGEKYRYKDMKKKINILFLLMSIITTTAVTVFAADVKFEASLDRDKIALGERVQLGLSFYGTQSMPAPDIGNIDGVEARYLGPSTMMTVINGKVSSSITHMYSIVPLKTGKFELGPFSFTYKGVRYVSNMAVLQVSEEHAPQVSEPSSVATEEKLDFGDRIFLTMALDKTKAYVYELIPVTVKLYVNRLNVRDIQLPTFAQESFSKAEFKEPKQYREYHNGTLCDVLEFKTKIFATRPGEYKLGPAKIKCNVIVQKRMRKSLSGGMDEFAGSGFRDEFFDDFFTHFERYPLELSSEDSPLIILPLPEEGRSANFEGAVGDFQFIYSANPKKVKSGDPIALTMEINGTGNFNTVLIPRIENLNGFKTYEPQIKTETNTKTFVQVLIPETDKVTQTPGATFSYFDPNKSEYRTIVQPGIPIQVEKSKEEAPAQVVGPTAALPQAVSESETLKRDIVYVKDSIGRTYRKSAGIYSINILLTIFILPLIFLTAFYLIVLHNERLKRDTVYAGRLLAYKLARSGFKTLKHQLRSGDPKGFYELVFKTLQDYFGNRLHIPSGGITYDAVEYAARARNVDIDILKKLERLFSTCDQARFAGLAANELTMKDNMRELEEVVRYFERLKI